MGVRLLEHPLIVKFFGCDKQAGCLHGYSSSCREAMAYKVMAAMEAEIKKGERRLYIDGMGAVWEGTQSVDLNPDYHPDYLRLSDAHQPKRECCEYKKYLAMSRDGSVAQLCPRHFRLIQDGFKESSPVEAKMKDIVDNWQSDATPPGLVVELEKLVELVRSEK